ncbi:17536_t:CDS:1, partial [Gigaspora margarita]
RQALARLAAIRSNNIEPEMKTKTIHEAEQMDMDSQPSLSTKKQKTGQPNELNNHATTAN